MTNSTKSGFVTAESVENYRNQVVRTFFKNGFLLKIPVQNRKRDVVLQKVSTRLIPDKMYNEAELAEVLKKIYPDFETLQKLLVASRFIKVVNNQFCLTSSK